MSPSEQVLSAAVLWESVEPGRPWPLSSPGCQFLSGTIFGRLFFFFILVLYHSPVGQMTAELQA